MRKVQDEAARRIQRCYRGYQGRKRMRQLRHDAVRASKIEAAEEATRLQAEACQTVLTFIEFMVARLGDRAAAAFKGSGNGEHVWLVCLRAGHRVCDTRIC